MTAVGFEPTPLRTGALSQRLRPLGQTVLFGEQAANLIPCLCCSPLCSVFTFWLAFLVASFVWLAFLVRCVSAVFVESPAIPGKLSVRASLFCSGVFHPGFASPWFSGLKCFPLVFGVSPTGCRFFVRYVSAVFWNSVRFLANFLFGLLFSVRACFPMALPRLVFWPHSVRHCPAHFPPDFQSVFGLCPPLASWLGLLAFCPVLSD